MNVITFPGLGLSFTLNRVAFTVFGHAIYWYGVIIAAGFLLGTSFCWRKAEKFGITQDHLLDVLIFATPAAIIGARLYYIVFYLNEFRKPNGQLDFAQMFRIHDGGLAIYGGIIFALLTCFLVTRAKKFSFLAMADLCVFGLLIGQIVGRWGNFMNVEAYGCATTLPWRMGVYERVNGVLQYTEVHPTFLYESLWNLLGFCVLIYLLHKGLRKFDGMFFLVYLAWYGFGRGFIEGLRSDSLYFFGTGLRVSQMLGFTSSAAAIVILAVVLSHHPDPAKMSVNQCNFDREEPDYGSSNT